MTCVAHRTRLPHRQFGSIAKTLGLWGDLGRRQPDLARKMLLHEIQQASRCESGRGTIVATDGFDLIGHCRPSDDPTDEMQATKNVHSTLQSFEHNSNCDRWSTAAHTVAACVAEAERSAEGFSEVNVLAGRYGPWADVVDPDELVECRNSVHHSSRPYSRRQRRNGTTRAILLKTALISSHATCPAG